MAYPSQNNGFQSGEFTRPEPVDVSSMGIKCANCGTDIKTLPFSPKRTDGIYCRTCLPNFRQPKRNNF